MPDDYEKLKAQRDDIVTHNHQRAADLVVAKVAALSDRDDKNDPMIVTPSELRQAVLAALVETRLI